MTIEQAAAIRSAISVGRSWRLAESSMRPSASRRRSKSLETVTKLFTATASSVSKECRWLTMF